MSAIAAAQDVPDAQEPPAVWSVPTGAFLARQAWLALSPGQCAAVRRRVRFHSMPWLRRADDADGFTDELP